MLITKCCSFTWCYNVCIWARAYFNVVLIFAGFWPFPRLITLFPCPDVSVLFRFTIGGGYAGQTFAFEFCRQWRTCLRRLSHVCPGHDGYHFCTETLYNVIVSFRASSKIDFYATKSIADPIFTISFALLSYSTGLEASCAPSFVVSSFLFRALVFFTFAFIYFVLNWSIDIVMILCLIMVALAVIDFYMSIIIMFWYMDDLKYNQCTQCNQCIPFLTCLYALISTMFLLWILIFFHFVVLWWIILQC